MNDSEIEKTTAVEHQEAGKVVIDAYHGDNVTGTRETSAAEKSLLWKIWLVIVPLSALMYFSAYMDRNVVGNASIMHIREDLKLSDKQWADMLSMFYIGYILCMLPANIIQRQIPPNYIVGLSCLLFGLFVACMSAAHNYPTVLVLRIFTGFAQSFIQGMTIYTSLWFRRDELAGVSGVVYSAATLSGAFGGLISYGIMSNPSLTTGSREPWRWLFIIEGNIGIFVGLLFFLLLPRFPDKIREKGKHWLFTMEEIEAACQRTSSFNTMGAKIVPRQILVALMDPKCWGFAFLNGGAASGIATVGVFLPTIVSSFGYSAVDAQLFSVIPYAVAFFAIIIINFLSDRFNVKGIPMISCLTITLIGLIILMNQVPTPVRVFAACLMVSGVYPAVTILSAWSSSNIGGFTKRATTWAMAEIIGQLFSIMMTRIYDTPPRYFKGYGVLIGLLGLGIIDCVVLIWWMRKENRRREAELQSFTDSGMVHPHHEKTLEELFDSHINFRYIL